MKTQQSNLITHQPDSALPGDLSRSIMVPPGRTALVAMPDGEVQSLNTPGMHQVRSWWQGLLGRQAPPVWLVATGHTTLHPFFPTLLAAGGELVEADMLVRAEISDPVRFWRALVVGRGDLGQEQLDWLLSGALQQHLRSLVRAYPLDSLLHLPESGEAIRRQLMPSLREVLAGWGMELQALTHLSFQAARDAVTLEEEAAALNNRLAEVRVQAEIDRLDNEAVLGQARADLEFRLTPAEEAEIEEGGGEEEEALAARLEQVLEARLARLEHLVEARLRAQGEGAGEEAADPAGPDRGEAAAAAGPAAAPAPAPSPTPAPRPQPARPPAPAAAKGWREDIVPILRIAAAALTFLAALGAIYFPEFVPDGEGLGLLVAALGLLLALLSLGGSWVVEKRLAQRRLKRSAGLVQARASARRQARLNEERAARHYLATRLDQVSANCREAMERVYEADLALASALRSTCVRPFAALAEQARQADYRHSPVLGGQEVTLSAMMELLCLNEQLLSETGQMIAKSREMYDAALANDLDRVHQYMLQLDKGRLALANHFNEREQFLLRSTPGG